MISSLKQKKKGECNQEVGFPLKSEPKFQRLIIYASLVKTCQRLWHSDVHLLLLLFFLKWWGFSAERELLGLRSLSGTGRSSEQRFLHRSTWVSVFDSWNVFWYSAGRGGSPGIEARTRRLWSLFLFSFLFLDFHLHYFRTRTPECGSRWELKAYFVLLGIVFNTFPYEGPVRVCRNQSAALAGRLNQTLRRARILLCCSTGSWAQRARRAGGVGGGMNQTLSRRWTRPPRAELSDMWQQGAEGERFTKKKKKIK